MVMSSLKGPYLWRGFRGSAQLSNESFKELDDILNGHVDAAFRMHNPDNPDDHDHIYFFMVLLGTFIILLLEARLKQKKQKQSLTKKTINNNNNPLFIYFFGGGVIFRLIKCTAIMTTFWRMATQKQFKRSSPVCPLIWTQLWSAPEENAWLIQCCFSRVCFHLPESHSLH